MDSVSHQVEFREIEFEHYPLHNALETPPCPLPFTIGEKETSQKEVLVSPPANACLVNESFWSADLVIVMMPDPDAKLIFAMLKGNLPFYLLCIRPMVLTGCKSQPNKEKQDQHLLDFDPSVK